MAALLADRRLPSTWHGPGALKPLDQSLLNERVNAARPETRPLPCLVLSEEGSCQGRLTVVRVGERTSGGRSRHRPPRQSPVPAPLCFNFFPFCLGCWGARGQPRRRDLNSLPRARERALTLLAPPLPGPLCPRTLSDDLLTPFRSLPPPHAAGSRRMTNRARGSGVEGSHAEGGGQSSRGGRPHPLGHPPHP